MARRIHNAKYLADLIKNLDKENDTQIADIVKQYIEKKIYRVDTAEKMIRKLAITITPPVETIIEITGKQSSWNNRVIVIEDKIKSISKKR